jgi:hypothetical protein
MPKERADGSPQLNLRVPLEHRERVRKVVALLRTAEAFPARLDELLSTASEPVKPSFLTEVVNRIERLEAELLAQKELTAQAIAHTTSKASEPPAVIDRPDSGTSTGIRKGAPLTPEELAEVRRLIGTTQMKNPEIGRAIAAVAGRTITGEKVRQIREEMRAETAAASTDSEGTAL